MDIHTAMEESYKNGYKKGYEDGSKTRKRGIWVAHTKYGVGWYECSECHICGSPQWKCCPVCETKMEPIPLDDSCPEVKTITINNIKREVKSYGEEQ